MPTQTKIKAFDLRELKVSCGSCSLSHLCLPHGLNSKELETLDESIQHKPSVEKGQALFHAGESLKSVHAIRSGSFKTVVLTNSGSEQITGFYLPGELIGLDGLGESKHRCTAVALESSTTCALDLDDLEKLCCSLGGLRRQFLHLIGHEINHDHEILLALGQMKGEERLAAFLLSLSRRLEMRGFSPIDFHLSMPRHDIANYLGLAVETLSRMFSRMQEEQIIHTNRRHVRILNMAALCTLAQAEPRSLDTRQG